MSDNAKTNELRDNIQIGYLLLVRRAQKQTEHKLTILWTGPLRGFSMWTVLWTAKWKQYM